MIGITISGRAYAAIAATLPALGLDAERGVDAEGGFEFGGSVVHSLSLSQRPPNVYAL